MNINRQNRPSLVKNTYIARPYVIIGPRPQVQFTLIIGA